MLKKQLILLVLLVTPGFLFAEGPKDFAELVNLIILDKILTPLISLMFGLAFVGFLWGAVQFITKGDDSKTRGAAKDKMLYGIIALAVMVSVWGLVKILTATFGIEFFAPSFKQ